MLVDVATAEPVLPLAIRARGGVRVVVERVGARSAPIAVAESGGYRVRFPRGAGCEAVLINTGGGMAGGDAMSVDVALRAGAAATVTTQAAEKIYRSQGDDTHVGVRLDLGPGAALAWLAQEQILFDGARFARSLDVEMAGDARLILVESVVFGRLAMGETMARGAFRDRWRVRRAGRLVFAEDVRLDGDVAARLARPALGAEARALATCLVVAPDAESLIEPARAALATAEVACGATALDGMLVARFMAARPERLRADLARFVTHLRGAPPPRSWQT